MAMTIKENFLATIRGEKAERFVNQYEYMGMIVDPVMLSVGGFAITMKPGDHEVNGWGVTVDFQEDAPGPMPVHTEELTVVKDVTDWKSCVKAPPVVLGDEAWAEAVKTAESIDRNEYLVTAFTGPGVFEKVHYLMGMEEAFINLYEEPEAMKDLINFIADWEIELGKEQIKYLQPEVLFHHDDWGSQISSFMSPEMFDEFLLPAYKRIYSFYKEHGVIIVHHSDSYAANLVPAMIEMGVDVWQGCLSTNNIPELIKQYGGKITFMGGIDSGKIDHPNWSKKEVREVVEKACRENGTKYYIPCNSMGGPDSIFPGVYDAVTEEVNRMSSIMFPA